MDAASALLAVESSEALSKIHTTVLVGTDEAVKTMGKAHEISASYSPPSG